MSAADDSADIMVGPLVQGGSSTCHTPHDHSSDPIQRDLAWNCVCASVSWLLTWAFAGITGVFVSASIEEQRSFDARFSRLPISLAMIVKVGATKGVKLGLVLSAVFATISLAMYGVSRCMNDMWAIGRCVERAGIVMLVLGPIAGAFFVEIVDLYEGPVTVEVPT
ncbi:uncharacterized protein SCHCODRAFT_02555469 [Schizophyllum commune H4-8]|nr:uncharacterized protein SCHCODRAFT_02555469 [Schizophyllum commune H4-8]KAI5886462.1 hypothetical protein SCHCODRAFT_02555469 [Schizophyllum commune H4-8]